MLVEVFKTIANLFTWFFTVAPWEQAIRVRFGKWAVVLGPGFYLRIPFVDRVFKQSIRRRLNIIRSQTLTTKDGKVVTCAAAIGYAIKDLRMLYDTLESPMDTIECEIAGIVADFVGKRNSDECSIEALEEYVLKTMKLDKYGLDGQEFYIMSFASAKTYRLITGEMPSWNRDDHLTMEESK